MSAEARNTAVLAVDLDGTLVCSDLFLESALTLIRQNPCFVFRLLLWLLSGRAVLKRRIAEHVSVDPSRLPYLGEVLEFVRAAQAAGRYTVLATGSDQNLVQPVADYLGCFDAVLASDGTHNRTGGSKASELAAAYGETGYDYIGNSSVDLPVWSGARQSLLAARNERVCRSLGKQLVLQHVFYYPTVTWPMWGQQLYLGRWAGNILVFAPLLLGANVTELRSWLVALVAFIALGLVSSGVFLALDLLNLARDRQQQHDRPLACGRIYLLDALLVAPVLLFVGGSLALFLPAAFVLILAAYCMALVAAGAGGTAALPKLFTFILLPALSLLAGSAAAGIPATYWLTGFAL